MSFPFRARRAVTALLATVAAGAALGACSSSEDDALSAGTPTTGVSGEPRVVEVTLTDDGCDPRLISALSGPTTFKVTSDKDSSGTVKEFEVFDGNTALGEVEDLEPGDEKTFSLTLEAGSFTTACPGGGSFSRGTLEVADSGGVVADSAAKTKAVDDYLTFVKAEADLLTPAATSFVAAIKANDTNMAKTLFAAARVHYETIEPIAESFGDFDPLIDAREGDVPEAEWGGFHRLEKALFRDGDISQMGPVADKLLADIAGLRKQIDTIALEPAQIANGAVELLNEVSVSKITGEEDRYSHTDLSDFNANLAGSRAAFEAVKDLLSARQADLSDDIERRFIDVQSALDEHRSSDPIGNGYALYDALTAEDTKALSAVVDTLAEPLSKVAAIVLA